MRTVGDEAVEPGAERFQIRADRDFARLHRIALPDLQLGRLIGDETAFRHRVLKAGERGRRILPHRAYGGRPDGGGDEQGKQGGENEAHG